MPASERWTWPACGIASQRDTDFVWDARTGRPLANAITWQDLRTSRSEAALRDWPLVAECRRVSGTGRGRGAGRSTSQWRMQNDPVVREAARAGLAADRPSASWVLAALGGSTEPRADVSLAQSINLWDFRARDWWDDWLAYLEVPRACAPGGLADRGRLRAHSTSTGPACRSGR